MKKLLPKYLQFLLVVSICIFYPTISSNISVVEAVSLFLVLRLSYLLGNSICLSTNLTNNFLFFSSISVSILLGLICLSFLLFIQSFVPLEIIYFLVIIFWVITEFRYFKIDREWFFDYKLEAVVYLCGFFYLLFIIYGEFLTLATHAMPVFIDDGCSRDNLFFITLVSSFRDGNFYSVFEEGSIPIYQNLSPIVPSFIAFFTGVSSQMALYGIFLPFCIFTFILLVIEGFRCFFSFNNRREWCYPLITLFFVCLQPVHIGYLLKLEFVNFVFGGIGYVMPSTNIGYTISMPIVMLILLFLFRLDQNRDNYKLVVLTVLLSTILLGIKVPMYLLIVTFVGVLSVYDLFKRKKPVLLVMLFFILFLGGGLYLLLFTQKSYLYSYLAIDFMPKYIKGYFSLSSNSFFLYFVVFTTFIIYLFWVRLFVFIKYMKTEIIWFEVLKYGSLLTLLILYLFSYLYNVKIVDDFGGVVRDGSDDALQFPRVAFFLVTILSTINVVWLFLNYDRLIRKILLAVFVFNIFIVISFYFSVRVSGVESNRNVCNQADIGWLKSVQKINLDPKLGYLLIDPNDLRYNMIAPASDIGTFWLSFGNSSLNYSKRVHSDRKKLYSNIIQGIDLIKTINLLKRLKASYFIATPKNIHRFEELYMMGVFRKSEECNFLFILR